MKASIKQKYIYFGKLMKIVFESVPVRLFSHQGFQLTMEGRQWVPAKNTRIGIMQP